MCMSDNINELICTVFDKYTLANCYFGENKTTHIKDENMPKWKTGFMKTGLTWVQTHE